MAILRSLVALGLTLAGAAPGIAQGYSEGENLIVDIPTGFVLANQSSTTSLTIEEYIPEDQTIEAWRELVTLRLFHDLGGTTPDDFLRQMATLVGNACPMAQIGEIQLVTGGAFPAAVIVVVCPDSPRTEGIESFAAYALGGRDRVYVVQYAWDRRPDDGDIADAQALFTDVLLCDTRRADAPCPAR